MELNPNGTTRMLRFFSQNIVEITKMVLSTGSVKDTNSHAEYLYYKNLIDKSKSANSIFSIKDILKNISNGQIEFGPKNGGTTITLPFGHLQMHQGRLQFHHDFKKINNLVLG